MCAVGDTKDNQPVLWKPMQVRGEKQSKFHPIRQIMQVIRVDKSSDRRPVDRWLREREGPLIELKIEIRGSVFGSGCLIEEVVLICLCWGPADG